jgi:acetyl-CoA acetyltransferase
MQKYGVTNEDLGHYVVTARQPAATNPNAWFYQRPITLADHQASRWIVEPILRLLDCCQESDGGVALIVTSAERARDLRQPGVRIIAANQAHVPDSQVMFNYYLDDLAEFEDGRLSAADLWRTSGLTPKDIDVAMLYENFSPIVFMSLEAFGFCGPGEAKDFIKEGHIGLTGSLPVNPNGGLLGEAYIHGMNNILEAVRQIRGTAANQIADVDYVLNSSGRSAAIFGRL